MARFRTTLGCNVLTAPAPEHLGPGVLLVLSMDPPDDRRAEVYLSPSDTSRLIDALHTPEERQ